MTRICEKFNEKIYPTGHVKKNGYFPTLGGGSPTKLENSNFFLTLPLASFVFQSVVIPGASIVSNLRTDSRDELAHE